MFSPGSIFKSFFAYGALALGLVDPEQKIFCPGHAEYYGREFHCHKKGGHGLVNLRNAIKMSCDVYFYNLGHQLGIDRIAEIATAFGFGEPTGVDISLTRSAASCLRGVGVVKRKARWYPSETISVVDRPGAAARHAHAGGAGARRPGRGRTTPDAAPVLRLAGAGHERRRCATTPRRSPALPIDPDQARGSSRTGCGRW